MYDVMVPHDLSRGPLTALRRMVVHSSIAELKQRDLFAGYRKLMEARAFEEITSSLGPGWLDVEVALAHYRACDALGLSDAEIYELGRCSCTKIKGALLVPSTPSAGFDAELSPWSGIFALWRMGRRVYQGCSAQYTRIGPSELLIEHLHNALFAIRYYRLAHVGFLSAAFGDFGVAHADVKLTTYTRSGDMVKVSVRWT